MCDWCLQCSRTFTPAGDSVRTHRTDTSMENNKDPGGIHPHSEAGVGGWVYVHLFLLCRCVCVCVCLWLGLGHNPHKTWLCGEEGCCFPLARSPLGWGALCPLAVGALAGLPLAGVDTQILMCGLFSSLLMGAASGLRGPLAASGFWGRHCQVPFVLLFLVLFTDATFGHQLYVLGFFLQSPTGQIKKNKNSTKTCMTHTCDCVLHKAVCIYLIQMSCTLIKLACHRPFCWFISVNSWLQLAPSSMKGTCCFSESQLVFDLNILTVNTADKSDTLPQTSKPAHSLPVHANKQVQRSSLTVRVLPLWVHRTARS